MRCMLSQINKGHGPSGSMSSRLVALAREAGLRGLFAGLGPRMIMTAGLVAGQFLIYDEIKHGAFVVPISVGHWDPILGSQLGIWDGIWDPNMGSHKWDGIFGPFRVLWSAIHAQNRKVDVHPNDPMPIS